MQYSEVYKIKQSGEIAKKYKKTIPTSMECGFISYINGDFSTDCDYKCITHNNIRIYFGNVRFIGNKKGDTIN